MTRLLPTAARGPSGAAGCASSSSTTTPLALELVRSTLEPLGWTVHTCAGGQQAPDLVRAVRPSVVVIDLLMPDVDGFAVIDELRPRPRRRRAADRRAHREVPDAAGPLASRGSHRVRRGEGRARPAAARAAGSRRSPPSTCGDGGAAVQRTAARRAPRRGQPTQPQAGARRAGVRRLHRRRRHDRRGGVSSRRGRALPDVILMDLQLPGIDGYAALALTAGDPPTAHIPVVALTAFAMRRDRERALDVGLRRLPREADQRARVPRAGARVTCRDARRSRDRPTTT